MKRSPKTVYFATVFSISHDYRYSLHALVAGLNKKDGCEKDGFGIAKLAKLAA